MSLETFTVATWPDGMRLIRYLSGAPDIETTAAIMGANRPLDLVSLALLDPQAKEAARFTISYEEIVDWPIRIDGISGFPSRHIQGAIAWVAANALGIDEDFPFDAIHDIVAVPLPESVSPEGIAPLKRMKTRRYSQANITSDAIKRSDIRRAFYKFFGHTRLRYVDTGRMDTSQWAIHVDGWLFYLTLIRDPDPVWTISDGNHGHLQILGRSEEGPYEALRDAGLYVMTTEYPQWLKERSVPGKYNQVLYPYALLGLPHPFLLPPIEFILWLEGIGGAG